MGCDASSVLTTLQAKAMQTRDADVLGTALVEAIAEELPQASWVGIYWVRGQELVLGPYRGPETEHVRIPFGTGVCGTAAVTGEDRRIDDVREVENYLACSADVRSEMVVLIESRGTIVGQIDLDANEVGAFDADDQCVVRAIADGFGGLIEPTPFDPDAPDATGAPPAQAEDDPDTP